MFTPDQLKHLLSIQNERDQTGTKSFADRLLEDGHPLAGFFSRLADSQDHPAIAATRDWTGYTRYGQPPDMSWLLRGAYGSHGESAMGKTRAQFYHGKSPGGHRLVTGFLFNPKTKMHSPAALLASGVGHWVAPITKKEMAEIHKAYPPYRQGEGNPLPPGKIEEPEQFSRSGSLILHV